MYMNIVINKYIILSFEVFSALDLKINKKIEISINGVIMKKDSITSVVRRIFFHINCNSYLNNPNESKGLQ